MNKGKRPTEKKDSLRGIILCPLITSPITLLNFAGLTILTEFRISDLRIAAPEQDIGQSSTWEMIESNPIFDVDSPDL